MSILLHYSPPASSSRSLPFLSWFPHHTNFFILEGHNFVVPATIYLTSLNFHSLTHCSPHPYLFPTFLSPLTWSGPLGSYACSFRSCFPTVSLSSCLPFWSSPALLPWPFLLAHPPSHCPSPAWISPRRLAFTFLGHTFLGVCIALHLRVTNQSVCTKMYNYF